MAKIVFFGTPEYVVPILDLLSREHEITAVVTQPPKPVGRKQFKEYSPVDEWAHKKRIPIYFNAGKIVRDGIEGDLGVLESYGDFIPEAVINHFKWGIINAHPSNLPLWRGAAPVQGTIISGVTEAHVAVIKLDSEWDHGPILSSFREEIREDDTTDSLRSRLFERSGEFLLSLIDSYLAGKLKPKEQDHEKATFTTIVKKADAFVKPEYIALALEGKESEEKWSVPFLKDFEMTPSAANIERFIRAMSSWPGAWTEITLTKDLKLKTEDKKRLRLLKSHVETKVMNGIESSVLSLDEVQLEGKNPVSWIEFKRGYPEASFI